MVTLYIDFEGGNDASAGTSFATRWKTITSGAAAARIAPGDEIRIMASPDPTSIGSATWTGGGRPSAVIISSSTNATPIVITTSAAHGLVAGDYVSIASHTTNTNANGIWKVGTVPTATTFQILQIDGSNTTGNGVGPGTGNVTKANNLVVKTATALVQNIALCGGRGQKPAWTASANVATAENEFFFKEGVGSVDIAITAGFTTGKAAYYTLPATLGLSSYQQVTFWIRQSSGVLGSAGQTYLALCTDTIGDTVAHQCNVPALGGASVWVPVTVNLGTNLNAAIRSVAFYVVTDSGAQTFHLDNIVACKASTSADSVTLNSLISKSDGTGDEAWYAIQSLNSDVIMLANSNVNGANSSALKGYNDATETVTTYKRETTKTAPAAATGTTVQAIQDSGTSGSLITFSGGWNRTDMSTQTGQTWYDGTNGNGVGLSTNFNKMIQIDRLNFCRYTTGFLNTSTGGDIIIPSIYATACTNGVNIASSASFNTAMGTVWANNNQLGLTLNGFGHTATTIKSADNCTDQGVQVTTAYQTNLGTVTAGNCGSSTFAAIQNSGQFTTITSLTSNNSRQAIGVLRCNVGTLTVNGGSTSGNVASVVLAGGDIYLNSVTLNETTELSGSSAYGTMYSNRHDNIDNNSLIYVAQVGTIQQQTTTVESPATTAWRMSPTVASVSATAPLKLKIGTVVCAASSAVTVTARMQRNNTGLTMRLCCPGGQINGVANDVTSDMTAAINTWETVTITFTPTKAGAVDIYAYAFGGTTLNGFVTNLTATQV